MVVGHDVNMEEVKDLIVREIIDHFMGKQVGGPLLLCWLEVHCKPLISYLQMFHILVRGWVNFTMRSIEDVSLVLEKD
jgi:hypothetical protein